MKKILSLCAFCVFVGNAIAQPNYPTAPPPSGNITNIEFFVDNKPEFGTGTALTGFTPSTNIVNFSGTANIGTLAQGFHRIYFRSKDADGKWSHTSNSFFDNYTVPLYATAPPATTDISNIEFFIDSKPEFGSGTELTGFTPSPNITNFNGTANFGALAQGFHRIYFRSKDLNNRWSLTNNALFDNYTVPLYATAPPAPTNITDIEFFIDSKPEFGSGTPLTGFTPSTNVSGFNGTASFGSLPQGFHRFYIRSKDASNKWSITNNTFFDNYTVPVYAIAPVVPTNIVQLEYFIDNNDLGFGNCTPISIAGNVTNITNLNANINVTGLVQGVHRLFIRSKDATNKWSLTNFSVFDNSTTANYPSAPAAAPAISNMEYFIDTDPGFGNATPLTVPGNTGNVNNYSVNLNLSGSLSVGTHYLHIRSKQNPWSITNIVPFSATSVTPVNWLYVKAQLLNNQAQVSWATAQEINTSKYEIEHSIDGRTFIKIGELNATGNSTTNKNYLFNHINPANGFNYYRIKQIDIGGSFKYSVVVTILKKDNLDKTIIAPNPVKDVLHVVEPAETFITNAEVFSIEGKLILRKTINADVQVFSIPVLNLPAAKYILKVNYKGETKSYQFIKD
jgi:hypothetical protein